MNDDISTNPKVSVIIPLYNQEKYFGKCIRSICNQTYKNLEIIVINDGSTDNSLSIAQKWAQKDCRIIVIDKKNEGTAFARRDGLLSASGNYVTFLDSDDRMPQTAIEVMVGWIMDKNVDIVMGLFDHQIGPFITRRKADRYHLFPF